jgi:hypothetical protein
VSGAGRPPDRLASSPGESNERVHRAGMQPVGAEIDWVAAERRGDEASAHPVARLEDGHLEAGRETMPRRRDPGRASPDDRHVHVVLRLSKPGA